MNVHFFDLDHTLLKVNCSYKFGVYLYRNRGFSPFSLFQAVSFYTLHKMGSLTLQYLHESLFRCLFKDSPASDLIELADRFAEEVASSCTYAPALHRLRIAQKKGSCTAILSSSPDFLVAPIAKRLSVSHWAATPYLIKKELFHSIGPVLNGKGKSNYVASFQKREKLPRENLYGYTDSHLDLPFLEAVGHPVAVNPDRSLHSISKRRGWEII